MEISLLLAAFALGLGASPGCLSVCLPAMVPMITSDRHSSVRSGLFFSGYLSLGRLAIYAVAAGVSGFLGHAILDEDSWSEGSGGEMVPVVVTGLVGIILVVYAVSLLKGWITPVCFAKKMHEGSMSGAEGNTASEAQKATGLPFVFGLLFGSMICPPFLILLGTALVSDGALPAMFAGMLFWVGTLPANLLGGAFAGEFGRRWRGRRESDGPSFVTNVSAMTLFLVGLWWILLALLRT